MAGAFRIAEGYVEVTADQSSYDRSIEKLKSSKNTVKVGVDLDDKDALARLTALAKSRTTKISLSLSGTAALTQLAEKTRDRTTKVIVSLDDTDALARLDSLTRPRATKVTIDLDQTPLTQLSGQTYTADIIAQINQAAYDRVKKALDKLCADRVVNIRASVDTRVAAQEIQNLVRRQRIRLGVDVDTRVAAADLANLSRTRTARVNVNPVTGAARLQLDALARDRHANINVGVTGGAQLASAGGGVDALSSKLAKLVAAGVAAFPTVASLTESLIQMGPAAALVVPAVLSMATAFAAIKIGTSGIGTAIKAAFAPATSAAGSAASSVRGVEDAERSLAKAQQGVKDAEVNAAAARVKAARDIKDAQQALGNTVQQVADSERHAAESVVSAEHDLAAAQRASQQAQEDLIQARKDAAAQMQDLSNQLADSQLSERQDVLALQDAQTQLNADKAAGASVSAEQLAKDQLAYDQAVQQLKEQQLQTQRLQDQNTAATAAGVDGSQQVMTAQQGVAAAQQDVVDKTQALKEAQIAAAEAQQQGAQQIAKAQRDVADAQAAAAKAATDGARSIADAQDAVIQAAEALAAAQTSGASATNKVADALAALSPQARAFVQAVIDQKAAWTALKLDVQDRLFQGLGSTLSTTATAVLPPLRDGLVGMAGVLNTMAKNALSAVTNLAKTGTLKSMFSGLSGSLAPLTRIPGQFLTALAQLSVAATPVFKKITTAAGNAADSIMKKLGTAFKSGSLTDSISGAVDIAKQFGTLLGNIFGTLNNVMKAAASGGGDALGTLGTVFGQLKKITASPEIQKSLTAIFGAVNAVSKLLAGTVGQVLSQLIVGLGKVAGPITTVLNSLGDIGPLLGTILLATNPVLGVLTLLAPILGDLAKPIANLVQSVAPLLTMLSDFAGKLVVALEPIIAALIGVFAGLLQSLAPVLAKVMPIVLQVVTQMAGPLAQVMQSLLPLVSPLVQILLAMDLAFLPLLPSILQLLPPIAQLAIALSNLLAAVLIPLLPVITALSSLLTGVLSGALMVLVPTINVIVGAITGFVNIITAGVHAIVDVFTWLYDTLVGHSIIPDLVNAIVALFTSLWTKTKQIFNSLKTDVTAIWTAFANGLRSKWNSFWSGLSGAITSARSWMSSAFSSLRTSITNTWSGLWSGVSSKFNSIIGSVKSAISSFSSAAKKSFTSLRDSLGSIWSGIQSKFSSPVKYVVNTVYNNGIRKMWDTIASKVSLPQLPSIKLGFNTGGVVPGQGTRDTVPAMLTPGERILSLSQVAKLGGHQAIDALVGRSDANKRNHYGIGGIISGIGNGLSGAASSAVGALSSAASWAKGIALGGLESAARKAIRSVINPLINRIPGSGAIGDLMRGIPKTALNGVLSALGKKDKDAASQGQIAYKAGAGVAQWAGVIKQALDMLGQSSGWLGTVERRMNQESGGNPSIVNKWDCLTLDAVILTQRGYLKHDEVQVGDLTIGYNPKTGMSEWTPVTRVVHFADAPLVRLANTRWSVTTTPNHRWVNFPTETDPDRNADSAGCHLCPWPEGTRRRGATTAGGLRIHLAKAHGIKGTGQKVRHAVEAQWVTTEGIKAKDRLLLAAPAATTSTLDITVKEAALLGWIAGDGHIERKCPTPDACRAAGYTPDGVCREHRARQNPSVSIAQTKPTMVAKLKTLLADVPHRVYVDEQPTRTGKQAIGPRHVFRFGYAYAQDLLARAGHPRDNAVGQVLAMSTEQRSAWLEGITDAEGYTGEAKGGNKPQVLIYQRPGPVLEAITLAVYLSGARPRLGHTKRAGHAEWSPESVVRVNNPIVTGHSLKRENVGHGDVWCVTTELGSWTAREGDHVFLTGNSNWAAGTPSVGLMQVIRGTFQANAGALKNTGPVSYGVSTNPLANTYAGLHYALHRYGSLSALNRPGGYDSGGLLQPGATMAVNSTGRPERVLTAEHTAKLDAMLDNATATMSGVTIQNVNINGTFDFSTQAARKEAAQAMVREMNNALLDYNRSIKRPGVGR